jgi:hypothetical protein
MLFLLPSFSRHYLCSFDHFTVTLNGKGQCSVFRDQDTIHSNVQLPMENVYFNAVAATYMNGEPCLVVAGWNDGSGVYLRHAVTLCEVRSLPYKEDVWCVCIDATGNTVFFGTESGLIF